MFYRENKNYNHPTILALFLKQKNNIKTNKSHSNRMSNFFTASRNKAIPPRHP
jgi:hypothetical protein